MRIPWSKSGCTDRVLVHARYDVLKGTDKAHRNLYPRDAELYEQAKHNGSFDAAYARIGRLLSERVLETLREVVQRWIEHAKSTPVLVYPRSNAQAGLPAPSGGGPANVLAVSFAQILSDRLGCAVDQHVTHGKIVTKTGQAMGRTNLSKMQRLLLYPQFRGEVIRQCAYILVDDVVTHGATLAALRSHIARNGGLVIAMTALGNQSGKDVALAVTAASLTELRRIYGVGIDRLWHSAARYHLAELTEQEARFLIERPQTNPNWNGLERGKPLLERLQRELGNVRS